MFKRHFSFLAIATLLLSPTVAQSEIVNSDGNLSVGNVQILNTSHGTVIQTPKVQVTNPKSTDTRLSVNRTRRRSRLPVRHPRTSTPMIINNKVNTNSSTTVIRTTSPASIPNIPTPTIRNSTIQTPTIIRSSGGDTQYPTPTVRSSTVRSSSGDSESVTEQHQSIQCSGSGSSVSQSSTTTVNGRTVHSESHRNCD